MARARGIKPGFFKNEELVELPFEARLLFIGLWTLADREGRTEDRPKRIKMEIFPADSVDVDDLLNQLAATGMLVRYSHGGEQFLQIVNFVKHQNPHRDERPSTIPAPYFESVQEPNTQTNIQEHGASTVQAPCNTSDGTMPLGLTPCILTPDSCILTPDSMTGGGEQSPATPVDNSSPPISFEFQEVLNSRPGLPDPVATWQNFQAHYPAEKQTVARWRKWVATEFTVKPRAADPPATPDPLKDPNSKASIEARGVAQGLGKWDGIKESFVQYRQRVDAAANRYVASAQQGQGV